MIGRAFIATVTAAIGVGLVGPGVAVRAIGQESAASPCTGYVGVSHDDYPEVVQHQGSAPPSTRWPRASRSSR